MEPCLFQSCVYDSSLETDGRPSAPCGCPQELIDGRDGNQIIYCPKWNRSKHEWGLINNYTLTLNRCKEGLSLEKPGHGGVLVMGGQGSFI